MGLLKILEVKLECMLTRKLKLLKIWNGGHTMAQVLNKLLQMIQKYGSNQYFFARILLEKMDVGLHFVKGTKVIKKHQLLEILDKFANR